MYKKKNKYNKYYIIGILILVIITSIFMVNREVLFLERFFKDLVIYPFTLGESNIDMSESYIIQKNLNIAMEEEISELKSLLDLDKVMTEFDVVNSTIISRNNSYWFNTITIDKGSNSKILEGMAVITSEGLVGRITKVYSNSSEVRLVTSDDKLNKVSVNIKSDNGDMFGVLSGYDNNRDLLIVEEVLKNTDVAVGDEIVTSGLGGVIPSGIYIGVVEEIVNLEEELTKTLYVKTKLNFNDFHYVSVLVEKSDD